MLERTTVVLGAGASRSVSYAHQGEQTESRLISCAVILASGLIPQSWDFKGAALGYLVDSSNQDCPEDRVDCTVIGRSATHGASQGYHRGAGERFRILKRDRNVVSTG